MADAPEIDGAVYVASRRPLRVGEIATPIANDVARQLSLPMQLVRLMIFTPTPHFAPKSVASLPQVIRKRQTGGRT